MIKTNIILGMDGNFPILHKNEGLAKNIDIAIWLFSYCEWDKNKEYELAINEETIPWEEGSQYFNFNKNELFILGEKLILN